MDIYKSKPVEIVDHGKTYLFKSLESHRNGVSGEPFFCAAVYDPEAEGDMLVIYFPSIENACCCAVLKLDLLPNLTFGVNSWRGDRYVGAMQKAIKVYRDGFDEWLKKYTKPSLDKK